LLGVYMRKLRDAHVGLFRLLKEDPPMREIPLPVTPVITNQMTWENGKGVADGDTPFLVFSLNESVYVAGIRLRYAYPEYRGGSPPFSLEWKRADQSDFRPDQRFWSDTIDTGPGEHVMTVWVLDTIQQLLIRPNNQPGFFDLYEIVLLVPVPLYSPGDRIVPSQVASDVYLRGGWNERGKEEIRWSSEEAVIEFSLTTTQLLHLRMMANTYQFEQPVIVRLNGQTVGTLRGDGGPLRLMELAMPSEAVHEDNTLT